MMMMTTMINTVRKELRDAHDYNYDIGDLTFSGAAWKHLSQNRIMSVRRNAEIPHSFVVLMY